SSGGWGPSSDPGAGTITPRRRLALAGAAGFLAVLLGVVIWVATDRGSIKIELNDPEATVRVDNGPVITVEGLGEPITLRAGEHDLLVTRGNLIVESRKFRVKRGPNDALRVELVKLAEAPKPPPIPVEDTARKDAAIKKETDERPPTSREPTKT